jgi:mannose-6-phosphate isomerase-like protein (cupin superfamily)
MINVTNLEQAKRVNKPWGYELWLECSADSPYVMKILQVDAGQRLSLQAHAEKIETMLILEGTGMLSCCKDPLDVARWQSNGYSDSEKFFLLGSIREVPIAGGSLLTINPGEIHRLTATTPLRLIECSTNHLGDVIRISDDHNRPSGHISSEHG